MGGRSSEHEVSLRSGEIVYQSLSPRKYNLKKVVIGKDGNWTMPRGFPGLKKTTIQEYLPGRALDLLITEKVDIAFLVLHGSFGEDGTIQGFLEMAGIPYTGSNVLASALAMHKVKSLELCEHYGLLTPKRIIFNRWDWKDRAIQIQKDTTRFIKYPCIVKPVKLGSSVATFKVEKESDLIPAIKKVVQKDTEGMIEEFIQGDEVTCAVLGNVPGKAPQTLPPTMIIPETSVFFDYEAKYTPGASREITPAPISKPLTEKVQKIALQVHQILGCGSMSRTDMIIHKGKIYLLETNTIPGMTATSLFPQAAKAAGISLSQLYDRLIQIALISYRQNQIKL